jgi:hypothetical protein
MIVGIQLAKEVRYCLMYYENIHYFNYGYGLTGLSGLGRKSVSKYVVHAVITPIRI